MARCKLCHKRSARISAVLGLCLHCIRSSIARIGISDTTHGIRVINRLKIWCGQWVKTPGKAADASRPS